MDYTDFSKHLGASPCTGESCQRCKEDGSAAFPQSAPASGCALAAAALAPALCAAGTLQPGRLPMQGSAGPAEEAWRASSVGWEEEAGRGAQA